MAVADYNTDPDLNVDISGINIAEGCPPSGINNAIRQMMADIKDKADSTDTAITTLDGASVKLSGAQTISGQKTFSVTTTLQNNYPILVIDKVGDNDDANPSDIRFGIEGSAEAALRLNQKSLYIGVKAGTDAWYNGAQIGIANNGNIVCTARNSSNNASLICQPDGTLTWGGNVVLKKASGTIQIAGTTITKGTAPSGTEWQNLTFGDKDLKRGAGLSWGYQTTKDSSIYMIVDRMDTASTTNSFNVCARYYAAGTTCFFPSTNGTSDLGLTNNKWNKVWAATGTIQTSDERLKSSINPIPDAILDAWEGVQWKQFQFNDSVSEKGMENARLHTGLIAQHIDEVFKSQGLDAARYGLFCHDTWDAQPEEKDDKGNVMQKARPAGDAYSLRYDEALCMEAAYQRRRANRAEARINALEQRLNEMEQAIAALAGGAE